MQVIIGIDPGKEGAICVYFSGAYSLFPMPEDPVETVKLLEPYREYQAHVFLEKAQFMPKQGGVSAFNYGTGYGVLLGILATLRIPHTLVHPRTWSKLMHEGTKKVDDPKARSLEAVRRLHPGRNLLRTPKCRTPDKGFVDAILITDYGRRQLGQ